MPAKETGVSHPGGRRVHCAGRPPPSFYPVNIMLSHYFRTIFRLLSRHRLYSFINILGLAFGMSCFILISLYIKDELSFDAFHDKSERIFRVAGKLDTDGQGEQSSSCPFPLGPALQNDYPHLVKNVTRFFNFQEPFHSLRYEDKLFNEPGTYLADSSVFEMFDFPLISGDRKTVLDKENSIVINEALAKKYFGDDDPLGKILRYDGIRDLEVTGIIGSIPGQSHIQFDALISFSTVRSIIGQNYDKNWVWNPCWTYLELHDGVSPEELNAQMPEFVRKHYPDFLKPQVKHYLQPLEFIHLGSHLEFEMRPNSYAGTVYIFSVIGIFILLIACINYMNLATARSAGRAREAGIRKVAGAYRRQLITQYILEAVVISLLGVVLSLALIELMLPWFNELSGKNLNFSFSSNFSLFGMLVITGLVTGVISGIYPAFVLSSYQPVQVLKGGGNKGTLQLRLRRVLVVLQFVISLLLIIGSIVVYRQLNHLRNVNPGFDKDQVVMIPVRPPMAQFFDSFIQEARNIPGVVNLTTMNDIIGRHHNNHEFNYKGMEQGKWIYFPCLLVDEDFVETMELEVIEGRDFSRDFPADDTLSVMVNEAMIKQFGWSPQEAVGQQFFTPHGRERIIGVLRDFNFVSLEHEVKPFVLDMPHRMQRKYWTRYIGIRIGAGKYESVISALEERWKTATAEYPFDYFFLDEDLDRQYQGQEKLAGLITSFSMLAVFIACLGLFALASFSAEQRTREIGIRKVLGATAGDVIRLLSYEFLRLICIAVLIAIPLGWYIMERWLGEFAYRISITADVFVIASLILMVTAFLTVLFKALQAASVNPARALRWE